MEPLSAHVLESLQRGAPDLDALARCGERDPGTAADAFATALAHEDLAPHATAWVPDLLTSARPGFGARCLHDLAELARRDGPAPLDLAATPALPRLLASSNVLARIVLRHPEWAALLEGAPPPPPDTRVPEPEWGAIRAAKYRGLLRIATRDLLGADFDGVLRELSDLADACLAAALEVASRETGHAPPSLLGLGKLGGRELNFSSDVDVLFLSAGPGDVDERDAHARLVKRFKNGLEERGVDGFGYRVDLDLRPEGRHGVLVNPVDVALGYYESFGAEWERQMLIRLRAVAGPAEPAQAFAEAIAPFVYRRAIDPSAMRNVRDMKARIEDERRRAGRDLEIDLKEGPGGIRDVEFLVQALQLFFGGRHPELRNGNVRDVLAALGRLGLMPAPVAAGLAGGYTWLRRAEHAVQLVEEQQTARFPRDRAEQTALARRLGYLDAEAEHARSRLLEDWTAVRAETRAHFEDLVLGASP